MDLCKRVSQATFFFVQIIDFVGLDLFLLHYHLAFSMVNNDVLIISSKKSGKKTQVPLESDFIGAEPVLSVLPLHPTVPVYAPFHSFLIIFYHLVHRIIFLYHSFKGLN